MSRLSVLIFVRCRTAALGCHLRNGPGNQRQPRAAVIFVTAQESRDSRGRLSYIRKWNIRKGAHSVCNANVNRYKSIGDR